MGQELNSRKVLTRIPKKNKVTPVVQGSSTLFNNISNIRDFFHATLDTLTDKSKPRVIAFKAPFNKQNVSSVDQGFTWTGFGINLLLYIFNVITYAHRHNKNLEASSNFLLDTFKVVGNIALSVMGIAAVTAAVTLSLPVIVAATAVLIKVVSLFALIDCVRSSIGLMYNAVKLMKIPRSSATYEKRKFYWEKTKMSALRAGVTAAMTVLAVVGTAVPGAVVVVSCLMAVGTAGIMIKPLYDVVKQAISYFKEKNKKASTTPSGANATVTPRFAVDHFHFREKSEFHLNGIKFSATDVAERLHKTLEAQKLQEKGMHIAERFKRLWNKNSTTTPMTLKQAKEFKKAHMPTVWQKMKKYDAYVVTKKINYEMLQQQILRHEEKLHKEVEARRVLGRNEESQKVEQKIHALRDLRFILRQLKTIMDHPDKKAAHILFLNVDKAQMVHLDGKDSSLFTIAFDNYPENKDKIGKLIKHYFDHVYPFFGNSFYCASGASGTGSGKVQSLFDSAEAWMTKKSATDLLDEINKLKTRYSGTQKKQTEENEKKEKALEYLRDFLKTFQSLLTTSPVQDVTFPKREGMPPIVYKVAEGKIFYTTQIRRRGFKNPFDSNILEYDLNSHRKEQAVEAFMTQWLRAADFNFSALNKSMRACGEVAEIFNEVKNWVCMQDFSHLAPIPAPPAVPPLFPIGTAPAAALITPTAKATPTVVSSSTSTIQTSLLRTSTASTVATDSAEVQLSSVPTIVVSSDNRETTSSNACVSLATGYQFEDDEDNYLARSPLNSSGSDNENATPSYTPLQSPTKTLSPVSSRDNLHSELELGAGQEKSVPFPPTAYAELNVFSQRQQLNHSAKKELFPANPESKFVISG